jgi:hypothetical protein
VLIAAAQRVEHYEIAAYGCLVTYAQLLGQDRTAGLLQDNLAEEEAADKKLSQLAEQWINQEAQSWAAGKRRRSRWLGVAGSSSRPLLTGSTRLHGLSLAVIPLPGSELPRLGRSSPLDRRE